MFDSWYNSLVRHGKPDEWEVKELLRSAGLKVPNGIFLTPFESPENLKLKFPVAVKVCDSRILHKTENSGVILDITSKNFVDSVEAMRKKFPGRNLLIEEMVSYIGVEFILGGITDSTFGSAVMVGAGGILTELYKDVSFRLAPVKKDEAVRMLKDLTVFSVLDGYRGSSMDINEFADNIVKVGNLIVEIGDKFKELDINPFVYTDHDGWMALDGMLLLK